jgi:putative tricarboxylic transport membrane protein
MDVGFDFFWQLFGHSLSLSWVIIPAVIFGIVVGAIPGFAAHNTIIILLPFTLAVDVEIGMTFMIALYAATHLGGGIPAILVNIPGTGGAAATTLDGYPMAQQGRAQQALVLCFFASVFGGLLTSIITMFAMPYLARVGYYMHSVEMVVVMLFGLTLIAVIAAQDTLKGLIAGFFGLILGAMGADHIYAAPRGTFDFLELFDGVPLIPALIGLFALSEAFVMIEQETILSRAGVARMKQATWADAFDGLRMAMKHWWEVIWTSIVGLVIGVTPGAGASIAAFVAYQQSRVFSKTPEKYGTGHPAGVIAPEAANNGVTSGTLVPLLALGIPGGSTAAVMLIVLQYHGVPMGPRLFIESPLLAYGIFMSMVVAYIFMIPLIVPMARYMARVTLVPTKFLAPLITTFVIVGAFAPREYLFDMWLALAFGVIGYIARKTGYHVAAILIGVILGPLVEQSFLRALRISGGDPLVMFSSTLGNILWALLVISIVLPYFNTWRKSRQHGRAREA